VTLTVPQLDERRADRNGRVPRLESIAMIGVDYRSAPLAIREALSVPPDALPAALARLGGIASECAILSTCNRTELYACLDAPDPGEALRDLLASLHNVARSEVDAVTTVRTGRAALEQLFAVSTGLNSMMVGEPHILSQVRIALDAARDAGTLGPLLSRAGAAALRVGKRVRTETGITRNGHSIPHAATERIVRALDAPERQSVVIIGAGQMAGHTARLLRSAGIDEIVVLNRSPLHAEALAHAVGGRSGPLDALAREIAHAGAVVSAVTVHDRFVLDAASLQARASASGQPLLVIDLGVPRTVDPTLREQDTVTLIDIDDLGQTSSDALPTRAADIDAMLGMITEEADQFTTWLEERAAAATIASLRERAEQIRVSELERALRRLGALSDRDREVVAALSVGLVGKLLHEPVVRLKQDRAGLDAAVQQLFGLDCPSDSSKTGA
jgi:glutamyl-tRNA reductase